MYKLAQWIYELGIRHERRRVRLLIAEHRTGKPDSDSWQYKDDGTNKTTANFRRDFDVWSQTQCELEKLLEPSYIQETMIAPLDKD